MPTGNDMVVEGSSGNGVSRGARIAGRPGDSARWTGGVAGVGGVAGADRVVCRAVPVEAGVDAVSEAAPGASAAVPGRAAGRSTAIRRTGPIVRRATVNAGPSARGRTGAALVPRVSADPGSSVAKGCRVTPPEGVRPVRPVPGVRAGPVCGGVRRPGGAWSGPLGDVRRPASSPEVCGTTATRRTTGISGATAGSSGRAGRTAWSPAAAVDR
ncbi:hypothetical protein [Streptomyces sp. NPDC053069]|uniref:hypothetical protein n=1 Tax=Streptomyces sp. NPDC053069 TaxID=3365695 RepID=UPI0037D76333